MNDTVKQDYWEASFKTYYKVYFQELASEELMRRWEFISILTSFLVAITASGSAMAGWALWTVPGWRLGWAIIAGLATVLSVAHGVMRVPQRIKEQESLRRVFRQLRIDVETFRQQLIIGIRPVDPDRVFLELRNRYRDAIEPANPDLAFTRGCRCMIQNRLNNILREDEVISDGPDTN